MDLQLGNLAFTGMVTVFWSSMIWAVVMYLVYLVTKSHFNNWGLKPKSVKRYMRLTWVAIVVLLSVNALQNNAPRITVEDTTRQEPVFNSSATIRDFAKKTTDAERVEQNRKLIEQNALPPEKK